MAEQSKPDYAELLKVLRHVTRYAAALERAAGVDDPRNVTLTRAREIIRRAQV